MLVCCAAVLFSCSEEALPVNHLPALYNDEQRVININEWRLVGPFPETSREPRDDWKVVFDGVSPRDSADYVEFMERYREYDADPSDPSRPHSFLYSQTGSYLEFDKLFNTQEIVSGYAACIITSEDDQDVAFQMVMDDAVKVWVNGEVSIGQYQDEYITKNKYAYIVHLNKGKNTIVVKLYNTAQSGWGFNLGVTSAHYARKYPTGKNYFSFSDRYLLGTQDTWHLRLPYPSVQRPGSRASLAIRDANGAMVKSVDLPMKDAWDVPLTTLSEDVYRATLTIDNEVLEQRFVRGDYKVVFSKYMAQARSLVKNDDEKINVDVLQRRFDYLEAFGERNVFDEQIHRKISAVLFDLAGMARRLEKHAPLTRNVSGWHLRGFRSSIDGSEDDYMLYVPDSIPADQKMPLVVIMPYVGTQAPFIESFAVALVDRNEMVEMLSRKYGMAVLWPSARIVAKYNLGPIVYASTFEAINTVKQDYQIDEDRVYLFGSCSGGLQAIITANRFPDYFAAVTADGPEISYTKCERGGVANCAFPSLWVKENSVLNTSENFRNLPVYIFHSQKDEKADFALSEKLAGEIRRIGGTVLADDMNNPIKQTWVNMIPDNTVVAKAFEFFETHRRAVPDTVMFSTYQLKYNQAYWITIDDLAQAGKSTIHAVAAGNSITVRTTNIAAFTIDLKKAPAIDPTEKIKVVLNGTTVLYTYPETGLLSLKVTGDGTGLPRKTHTTEGPVNDIFSSRFIVVKGTSGSAAENKVCQAAVDTLLRGWSENLYSQCTHVVSDNEVTEADLKNANLILVGSDKSNEIIGKLKGKVPLTVTADRVVIGDKKFAGDKLTCLMLYPNPYNARKYILIVTTNYTELQWSQLRNLPLQGWYDYQVWNNSQEIAAGNFTRDWR